MHSTANKGPQFQPEIHSSKHLDFHCDRKNSITVVKESISFNLEWLESKNDSSDHNRWKNKEGHMLPCVLQTTQLNGTCFCSSPYGIGSAHASGFGLFLIFRSHFFFNSALHRFNLQMKNVVWHFIWLLRMCFGWPSFLMKHFEVPALLTQSEH